MSMEAAVVLDVLEGLIRTDSPAAKSATDAVARSLLTFVV